MTVLFADLEGWLVALPRLNASLNAVATLLLLLGYRAIKLRREQAHKRLMLAAFGVSIAFLASYVIYHYLVHYATSDALRRYSGPPPFSYVYYAVLLTHVVLAASVPFLATRTIWLGLKNRRESHRRLARITFPIWLYVSITGVLIYIVLYHLQPG